MANYTVNCPACGKCFEYSELLETVFCSSCGKKLHLEWRIDRVTLDDGTAPASSSGSSSAGTLLFASVPSGRISSFSPR